MPTTTDRPSRIAWLVPLGALLWIAFVVAGFLILPSVLHRSLSAAELNRLPVEQRIPRQQDQWKLQDDVRSALVQGSVGLLALVGASVGVYVGWRQLQLTREGQVTDRFLRAVDQLGSDKVEVRFGGIYALERIARDSPSDRSAITEVLSAYVRRHLPGSEAHEGYVLPLPFREPDAQAALSVLCRPPLSDERIVPDSRRLNLSRTDLRRADLRKAELHRADLSSARLEGADLRGAHLKSAILDKANLGRFQSDNPAYEGGADLSHADLTGAKLDDVVGLDLAEKDRTIGLRT
jgi:hypothetical protein